MKKLLLACMAAATAAGAWAAYPTEAQLTQRTVAVMLNGNSFQLSLPIGTMGGSFTKNSRGFTLNNFYDGLNVNFNYNAKTGKLTFTDFNGCYDPHAEAGKKVLAQFTKAKNGMYTATVDGQQTQLMCWESSTDTNGFGDFTSTTEAGDPDGVFGWAFGDNGYTLLLEHYDITNGTSNPVLLGIQAFNNFQVYIYPCNSTCTEMLNGMPSDMYPVDVVIDGDKISIKNFLNQGMSALVDPEVPSYSLGFVNGTVDMESGIVELPVQTIGGDVDYNFKDSFLGQGDLFDGGPYGFWFNYVGTDYYPWILIDSSTFDKAAGTAMGASGVIESGVAHHEGTNPWVGHDGDCKTQMDTKIEFENVGVYGAYYNDIVGGADRMTISTPVEKTAGVKLAVSKANYYGNKGTAMGMLSEAVNTENVDHFDIYAVPGKFSSVNDANFYMNEETGHRDAFLVYDGSAESDLEYMFMADFDCGEQANTGNKDFTFFVKTNYKPESGLTPTFHAMTGVNATNGTADITAGDAAVVSVADGRIIISGSDADAAVYTPAGAMIYSGDSRDIAVAPGLYIVKVGETVAKVTVK